MWINSLAGVGEAKYSPGFYFEIPQAISYPISVMQNRKGSMGLLKKIQK